jgi:hypothetical protein
VTPKHLKAVIHNRKLLHNGFLRVYEYEFDVEKHGGGVARIPRRCSLNGCAAARSMILRRWWRDIGLRSDRQQGSTQADEDRASLRLRRPRRAIS